MRAAAYTASFGRAWASGDREDCSLPAGSDTTEGPATNTSRAHRWEIGLRRDEPPQQFLGNLVKLEEGKQSSPSGCQTTPRACNSLEPPAPASPVARAFGTWRAGGKGARALVPVRLPAEAFHRFVLEGIERLEIRLESAISSRRSPRWERRLAFWSLTGVRFPEAAVPRSRQARGQSPPPLSFAAAITSRRARFGIASQFFHWWASFARRRYWCRTPACASAH
jgi:hypothetical protein